MELQIYNTDGEKLGQTAVLDKISSAEISIPLLHEVVSAYLANQRSGTASTKTRAEVRGGGAKPWNQKHTGRARQGSIRSPLWRKGGITFGPKPKSWRQEVPKKKIRKAFCMALKSKTDSNDCIILKELKLENCKTSKIQNVLNKLKLEDKKVLLIVKNIDKNLNLSTRNIPNLRVFVISSVNTYEILNSDKIIFTEEAFNELNSRIKEN